MLRPATVFLPPPVQAHLPVRRERKTALEDRINPGVVEQHGHEFIQPGAVLVRADGIKVWDAIDPHLQRRSKETCSVQ